MLKDIWVKVDNYSVKYFVEILCWLFFFNMFWYQRDFRRVHFDITNNEPHSCREVCPRSESCAIAGVYLRPSLQTRVYA